MPNSLDSLPNDIQHIILSLKAQVEQQQEELKRQRDEILILKSVKPRPKPVLPDPEKFDGKAYKFDTWLPSIKAKLRVDGEAIGNAVAQFYYVYLNLESHVQAMVLPQLASAEASKSWAYTTILDQLTRVYDRITPTRYKRRKISCSQSNKARTLFPRTLLGLNAFFMRQKDRIGRT